MGCAVIRTSNRHITHKMVIDERTLDRVAEALGIPAAQRAQFISDTQSIFVYRGTFPTASAPPSPGAPPPPPGGASRP
jgi:hypothetical protein